MSSADLTATELLTRYRSGELSPVQACRDTLVRIEAHNDAVTAFHLVDAERALAQAAESEQRWQRGEPRGLLDGVPTSIKDVLLTAGWPTLRGSLATDPRQEWTVDAPAVARLRENGAVLLGKTTTPELGWKGVTDSPVTGVTGNPWDPSKTAGGSSGGAAAAVALGMGPLAVGTDGGGSVRIPAGFSGVFAHKATYGRVPVFPASAFGTLAHVGPITWSVADAALMLDVMSGADARDWSAGPAQEATRGRLDDGITGIRIAYSPTLGYVKVDPEVAAVVAAAVKVFRELGATVEEVDPGFADPVESFHTLWFSGAAASVAAFPPDRLSQVDSGLLEIVEQGKSYSALDHLAATSTRMELGRLMGEFHRRFDLLITPTLPIPAFDAGQEVPTGWPGPRWTSWTPFAYPFNMTQQPAASLPCGFTSAGLPVGLQVVGPRHADARVLTACRAFEEARPWSTHRPPMLTP